MDEKAIELRVGLVVLAAIGVLMAFVLLMGDFHFAQQYKIYVDFKFSGTIAAGAPVRISGVQIGRVEGVEFLGNKKPASGGERLQTRLTVSIDESARDALPEGTEFFISTAGILGEQYLEAVPGDRMGEPIKEGATIRGIDPTRTDILLARLNTVLDAIGRLMSENKGLMEDLAKSATGLTTSMDEILRTKRTAINEGLDNLVAISKDAKAITEKVNRGIGSPEELRTMVVNMEKTLAEAQKAIQNANVALEDKERLKRTMQNLDTLASNGAQITDDAKVLTKKIRRGEGSIGALLGDEDIYDDLKELLRDVKQHPWKIIWRD